MIKMSEIQRTYKYRISFSQTSKGAVYFDASIHFDEDDHEVINEHIDTLELILKSCEIKFKNKGHKLAIEEEIIKPKTK